MSKARIDYKSEAKEEIARARHISKSLGTHVAARYLALRGYSIEAAMWILAGSSV